MPTDFAGDVACVATAGTGGCGFEQPLEAVLKALTPSTSPITFHGGMLGHGDATNDGFLRPDSVLTILLLTDEDDCSAADINVFNPASATYSDVSLNLRCIQHEALHPLNRYVEGLLRLRDDPRDLIFATISGVPTDLAIDSANADYNAILSDPRMVERIDPEMPTLLISSCSVSGRGEAFPPRRIVQVAQGLEARGATSVVGSICQQSFAEPASAILDRITSRLSESCTGL